MLGGALRAACGSGRRGCASAARGARGRRGGGGLRRSGRCKWRAWGEGRSESFGSGRGGGGGEERPEKPEPGKLEVVVGPMFAGKTTHLLKRVQTLRSEGLMVQLVKPSMDDRYDRNSIVSHNQMKLPATVVDMLADVPEAIGPERWKRADVVGIDEGQFFPDLEATVRDWVDKHDKHVLVYGLKGSHTRRAFGEMHKLLANADKFEMLEAKCHFCQAPAPHSIKVEGDQRVVEVVGGKEMYAAVCRYHYNMLKSSGTISSQANQAGQEGSVV